MSKQYELGLGHSSSKLSTISIPSVGDREGTIEAPLPRSSKGSLFLTFTARIAVASATILLLGFMMLATPVTSSAQVGVGVGVSVNFAPPPLPVY